MRKLPVLLLEQLQDLSLLLPGHAAPPLLAKHRLVAAAKVHSLLLIMFTQIKERLL